MKFTGEGRVFAINSKITIDNIEITKLFVSDLQKLDKKCSQCMEFFEEGDDVVFIAKSIFNKEEQKFEIDEGEFIHVKSNNNKSSCLEDYISRFLLTKTTDVVELVEKEDKKESVIPGTSKLSE